MRNRARSDPRTRVVNDQENGLHTRSQHFPPLLNFEISFDLKRAMTTLKSRVRVTIDPSGTVATAIETSVSSGATIDQPLQAAEARPASVLSDSTMLSSIAAGELFGVLVKRSAELPYRFPTEHNRLTAIIAAAPETRKYPLKPNYHWSHNPMNPPQTVIKLLQRLKTTQGAPGRSFLPN